GYNSRRMQPLSLVYPISRRHGPNLCRTPKMVLLLLLWPCTHSFGTNVKGCPVSGDKPNRIDQRQWIRQQLSISHLEAATCIHLWPCDLSAKKLLTMHRPIEGRSRFTPKKPEPVRVKVISVESAQVKIFFHGAQQAVVIVPRAFHRIWFHHVSQ